MKENGMSLESSDSDVATATARAAAAAPAIAASEPAQRARWLEAIAAAIDAARDEVVDLAHTETRIAKDRLTGEVARTAGQLRLFATVCRDGGFEELIVDHSDPDAKPLPVPDVRRRLTGIGPVAVFTASNFPFAFSVAGGDTASALAAGCPVVVKAHPGHPELSVATAEIVVRALDSSGAPEGTFGLVQGVEAGVRLVDDPLIKAAGFTGSIAGGRALFDRANARPSPIPFYGELGSLNPVYVTQEAAAAHADEIAAGFVDSMTLGDGRLCTKPGLLFVPRGSGIPEAARAAASRVELEPTLGARIEAGFQEVVGRFRAAPGVQELTDVPMRGGHGPSVFTTSAASLLAHEDDLLHEAFGPAAIIVEYADLDEVMSCAAVVPNALTAGIFGTGQDRRVGDLVAIIHERAGRLIWNGWPTGVAVTWGMHHGGPYPASTAPLHTSVGSTAIRRWLRPVAYQNWPSHLLPPSLRDGSGAPARVDGKMTAL
jgi:NADP-dependent aldehyde dehydrogenase